MRSALPLLIALLSVHLPAQEAEPKPLATPGIWNQWRGPDRTGHVGGSAWPARLTKENLRLRWSVPLGPSYSGPVVDAKRVYTTETVDKTYEMARALDRLSGKELWRARWDGAMQVPFFAAKNGSWIRATPALDDGRLYVAGMLDVLVCLDAESGKVIWTVDFKERYATSSPAFGFVSSPLVHGDFVYVQAASSLVKLDKKTGKSIWRALDDGGGMMGGAFSSPIFTTLHGVPQVVVQTRQELHGVDDATGTSLWGTPVKTFRGMNILTPVRWGDTVFTSAYGGRGHLFAIRKDGDGLAVTETWESRAQGNMTTAVVLGDHAYLYLRSKRFCCVDLASGEVTWFSDPLPDTYWSLVAREDRILALSDGGDLRLIAADPKAFTIVDQRQVAKDETWAHLALDGDQLFVRSLAELRAFVWR